MNAGTQKYLEQPSYQLSDKEQRTVYMPDDDWSAQYALNVVVEDFDRASNYRYKNHDWSWSNADELILGYEPQKYWEGTKVPRANISVMTAYEQIESVLPRIIQNLFGDADWFDVTGVRGTKAKAARTVKDLIMSQLAECR